MELEELQNTLKKQEDHIASLRKILQKVIDLEYNKSTKDLIISQSEAILQISGTGNWMSYKLKICNKRDLVDAIVKIANRLIYTFEISNTDLKTFIERKKFIQLDPKKIALKKIESGDAELVGEGLWVKDSAYRVYRINNQVYTIIVHDNMNLYLMDDTLEEITESQIQNYI